MHEAQFRFSRHVERQGERTLGKTLAASPILSELSSLNRAHLEHCDRNFWKVESCELASRDEDEKIRPSKGGGS